MDSIRIGSLLTLQLNLGRTGRMARSDDISTVRIPGMHIRYLYLFLLMETVWHAVPASPTYWPTRDCHLPGVSYLGHDAALYSSRPLRDSLPHYSRSTRHFLAYGDVLLPHICCPIAYLPCFLLHVPSLLYVVTRGLKKCTLFYFFQLFD